MKKQFLILFAFISVLALSQVPQRFNKVIVTGDITSPKFIRTGSNADSVLIGNGSARAISTIKTDTTSLSNRINTKQETLVSGTNIRTVNGNSVLGSGDIQIVSGGGGSPVNIYLSNVNSTVSGYKEARPNIDISETVKTITATPANTITWGEKYLYTSPVSTTVIPSGFWELHAYGHISTSTGVSKLVFRVLRYSAGVETVLATFTGFEVNNITDTEMYVNGSTNDIAVLAGDYLGIQVGFLSDGTSPARTLTYTIGDGNASHFNTPLPTRHSALRDKNGEVDFQHLTAAQVATFTTTSANNTGDETLTSIKTKLGAATSVSDGYLKYQDFADFSGKVSNATHTGDATGSTALTLATVNSNVGTFNNVTINAKGLATAGSNVSYLTGITSGQVTTALGYTPKPTFTENTGFNKPFGTTTGTVLEGRTFGTAANSAVGDFQPTITGLTTNSVVKWNGNNFVNSSLLDDGGLISTTKSFSINRFGTDRYALQTTGNTGASNIFLAGQIGVSNGFTVQYNGTSMVYTFNNGAVTASQFNGSGAGLTGSTSAFSATPLSHSHGNITNVGLIGTTASLPIITGTGGILQAGSFGTTAGTFCQGDDARLSDSRVASDVYAWAKASSVPTWNQSTTGSAATITTARTIWGQSFNGSGNVSGALTGATTITASGNIYSNGGELLTPVYQTQTTVNGSTSGSMVCSMPFRTGSYKKVVIYLNSLNGNVTYTYPVAFTNIPLPTYSFSGGSSGTAASATSITINAGVNMVGWITVEGY